MADYNPENAAKLKHLASLASKTSSALAALDTKFTGAFRSLKVNGNTVNFYASTDASGNAVATFDFPEEMFLQQTGTEIVEDFKWSAETYPDSVNPNLDGKTVFVLAVKGDKETNPTVKFSFVNLEKLIQAVSAGDNSITIDGHTVKVKISAAEGNRLKLKEDGLFVGSDDTKLDKVPNAVQGNFATWGLSGAIVDSGFTFATDAEVNSMLEEYFPTGGISSAG